MGDSFSKGIGSALRRNNPFGQVADQLAKLNPDAVSAAESFTKLARRGYVLQAALGALAGSLGAVVGGLGALIGVAGGAAASLVAVGAAAITLGVGMRIASFAFKGISQAVSQATQANGGFSKSLKQIKFDAEEAALSVTRAELNLERAREGLARVADLAPNNRVRREAQLAVEEAELALRRARDAEKNPGAQPGAGGTDPFAGLTPAQKEFAKYLASLKPLMDDLREAAAKGFLPILQRQIEKLIKAGLFDILERRFFDIAKAAGVAVKNFTDIFLSGDNLRDFDKILGNIADTLPSFGTIFGNAFGAFLSIMEAADPLTRRFVGFLEKKTGQFAKFLDTQQALGGLTRFFNQAGNLGAIFGRIFGNVFAGLGSLIEANFGPGSGGHTLLLWLDEATSGWRNLDLISQQKYFRGAADNFIAMGDAIGGAIDTIIQQGSNPAIKEFWTNLDQGSAAFDTIIRNSVNASPALGDLLRVLTEISALLTDTNTAQTFFETLGFFAQGAREILEILKPLLDFAGPFFAAFSAIKLVQGVFTLLALAMKGFFISAIASLGTIVGLFGMKLPAALTATTAATGKATLAMKLFNLTNPVGWVATAITLVGGLALALGGIKGDQMDRAMKGVEQGFKDGASGAKIWESATLAVNDTTKQNIKSVDQMKEGLNKLAKVQKGYSGPTTTLATASTTALADSFEAMGTALGNVAVTDLPQAQANFKRFNRELGLNKTQTIAALNEMDEYKKSLIEQADAMGISVKTTSGAIDMNKLYQFSMGEGEIAVRLADQAQQKFNDSVLAASKAFVDHDGAMNQNKTEVMKWAKNQADKTKDASDSWKDYWDGQGFSMEKYLDDLEKQQKAAKKWRDNIAKLTGELPQEVMDKVVAMGEAGAELVAGLTDGVNDAEERRRFINSFSDAGFQAGKALTGGLNRAVPKGVSLRAFMDKNKDGGYIGFNSRGYAYASGGFVSGAGTARSDSIPAMLSNGEYVVNARATAQNRTLLDAINSNKSVATAPTINMVINPSAQMNEKELATEVSRQLAFQIRRGGM
jgi:hypothetical protein